MAFSIIFFDILRWLVVGLSIADTVAITVALVFFVRQHPRPGRLIGSFLTATSYIIFLLAASLGAVGTFGQPPLELWWLRILAVSIGSLGLFMILMHFLFHDKKILGRVFKYWAEQVENEEERLRKQAALDKISKEDGI